MSGTDAFPFNLDREMRAELYVSGRCILTNHSASTNRRLGDSQCQHQRLDDSAANRLFDRYPLAIIGPRQLVTRRNSSMFDYPATRQTQIRNRSAPD